MSALPNSSKTNRLPSIRHARKLAKDHGLQGAIVIGFAGGAFSIASYGGTKAQCKELAALVDFISEAIEQEEVSLSTLDAGDCPWRFIEQGSET